MAEPEQPARRATMSRRRLLAVAGGAVVAGGGSWAGLALTGRAAAAPRMIQPGDAVVAQVEARRYHSGRTVQRRLLPRLGQVDLAGVVADTWMYDRVVPGPELRVQRGDELAVTVVNGLPAATSVHWHGIRIRNDMDGVPGMTEPPLLSTEQHTYRFVCADPGTYWYHPHVGVQRDRGLYGALVVEDPHDPVHVDHDVTVLLDDWIDGLGTTPDAVLARLQAGSGGPPTAPVMDPGSPWGPMLGDVDYPYHLINGRPPADPASFTARPGERVRFRLCNAGADTDYRVALAGHRLTVVAADGWPVEPFEVGALLIGKGERYDVVVTAGDGAFPLVAAAEGRRAVARAVLRTASGSLPPAGYRPPALAGPLLDYSQLRPAAGTGLADRAPDRRVAMVLARDPRAAWRWTIDGRTFPDTPPVDVHLGERVRITFLNSTDMAHPMHIHGHTFALTRSGGGGARKDTAVVLPGGELSIDVQADNPGQWMFHCHDEYHLAGGMATVLSYLT